MFFTCVACAQELAALALARVEPVAPVRTRPTCASCSPADASSTAFTPSRRPEVPHRVHVVVLGQRLRERVLRAGHDVDHAAGHVGGLEHLIEVRRGERVRSDGITTTVLPIAIAGATSDTKPSSGMLVGAGEPTTPIGSFIASATPRIGTCAPRRRTCRPTRRR